MRVARVGELDKVRWGPPQRFITLRSAEQNSMKAPATVFTGIPPPTPTALRPKATYRKWFGMKAHSCPGVATSGPERVDPPRFIPSRPGKRLPECRWMAGAIRRIFHWRRPDFTTAISLSPAAPYRPLAERPFLHRLTPASWR